MPRHRRLQLPNVLGIERRGLFAFVDDLPAYRALIDDEVQDIAAFPAMFDFVPIGRECNRQRSDQRVFAVLSEVRSVTVFRLSLQLREALLPRYLVSAAACSFKAKFFSDLL
jgi:hypothetical protein